MQNLNEAVINLINEDVINGKKLIENELYNKLGIMLEEKLKDFAPTIFNESSCASGKKGKKYMEKGEKEESKEHEMAESVEESDGIITEDYEALVEELQSLVEEIEAETGEELTEGELEELASILLESMEVDPDEEEETDEEDEEIEEDFDDSDEE